MEYIQIAGKSDIYLALDPASPSALTKIGEQMDETQIEIQHYFHDVHGDRHGGPQGPPIERQILGMVARANFALSRWDPAIRESLHGHNIFDTPGTLTAEEIGGLLFLERSYRLVIVNSKTDDAAQGTGSNEHFGWNFPCCTLSSPVVCGQGTKHSILQFSMEAHRAPTNHPSENIVYNRDLTGVPV